MQNLKKVYSGIFVNFGTKKVSPTIVKKLMTAAQDYAWPTHSTPEGRVITSQEIDRTTDTIEEYFFNRTGIKVKVEQEGPKVHYSTGSKNSWVIRRMS